MSAKADKYAYSIPHVLEKTSRSSGLYGLGERQIVASARGLAVKLPEISNGSFWTPSVNEYGRTTPAVRLCGMYTAPSRHDLIQFLPGKGFGSAC
jgi:hypothetical protein